VRDKALLRAGGNCEYCGEQGFQMADGNIYLETHHIVPLSEGGKDFVTNVSALCANHHRQAHHGKNAVEMRRALLKRI
jgi:5-methylcytosine-specific restriction protein A